MPFLIHSFFARGRMANAMQSLKWRAPGTESFRHVQLSHWLQVLQDSYEYICGPQCHVATSKVTLDVFICLSSGLCHNLFGISLLCQNCLEAGWGASWGSYRTFRNWGRGMVGILSRRHLLPLASKQDPSGQWDHWAVVNVAAWVKAVGVGAACRQIFIGQWQLPVLCTRNGGPGRTEHQ